MKAMIFAAGKGTRLGELTINTPKVMMDINGKSMLQHVVEKCAVSGFEDIIVNVHYLAGMVEEEISRLKNLGYKISVSDEKDELLDTAGGLYNARHFFGNEPFLLYNADIFTDLDIRKLYQFHMQQGGLATLAVRNRAGKRFFMVNGDGLLCGWINRESGERIIVRDYIENLEEIAFSSIHIVEPEIFEFMHEGVYSMRSVYLDLASTHEIYTYTCNDGYWFDIGTPEKLEEARNYLKKV
jgi:MurNAc alpha-1-phosphate uridylyltransferase